MNLVAKEFVAARDDEQGVLVLSTFAGAARELRDALLVNPYDAHDLAEALDRAVRMPVEEQRARMARMRNIVGRANAYRWARRMLKGRAAGPPGRRVRRRDGPGGVFDVKPLARSGAAPGRPAR